MLTVLTVSSALVLIVMILRPGPAFTLQRDLDAQPSGEKSAAAVRTDCSRYEREHLIQTERTMVLRPGFIRLPPVKAGVSL